MFIYLQYGLLNLDIAWCYLSLQSIAELPEAEARLQKCERSLRRSYGEDMERVVALKGSTGWEAALFVRLHLLQAIAAYHLGQIEKSRFLMTRVETELGRLKVSDDKLAELINMGMVIQLHIHVYTYTCVYLCYESCYNSCVN